MYNVTTDGHRWSRLFMAIIAAICVTAFVASDASAQRGRDRDEREEGDENRVFSAKVGEIVLRAQEAMTAEDNVLATQELNTALAERNVSPYELGIILHMRGALKYGDDDLDGALADWTSRDCKMRAGRPSGRPVFFVVAFRAIRLKGVVHFFHISEKIHDTVQI